MGISSALYSGVSGLNTNSQAMSVIGNNLANTNTIGFKGARTVFSDLLSSSINGSGGKSQVGRGVNVSKVDNIYSQGTFESTESGLDVAIEGDSFFMLSEPGDNSIYYSRAGAFRFDENGFLVSPEGLVVQGKQYDKGTGELIAGDPSDIQVTDTGLIKAFASTEMVLNTNLDASESAPTADFDHSDPTTFNYSSSTEVFDSLGNPHLVTTYFRRLPTIPGTPLIPEVIADPLAVPPIIGSPEIPAVPASQERTWDYYFSYTDGTGAEIDLNAGPPVTPSGQLNFREDGTLPNAANDPLQPADPEVANLIIPDWLNGSLPGQEIQVTIDTTQFNSASSVISQNQNGFGAGNLTGVNIDSEGAVVASYSNGEQIKIAHITLAKFNNPNGLKAAGTNLYVANEESGAARIGIPGPELGKIFTNSLEQSNVDMGAEFVRMITVQRGFQANSKIITTVDELLGELINLKR